MTDCISRAVAQNWLFLLVLGMATLAAAAAL